MIYNIYTVYKHKRMIYRAFNKKSNQKDIKKRMHNKIFRY